MEPESDLDGYSKIVAGVAAELTPKVASLRVPQGGRGRDSGRGGEGLGSAVLFTGDGFLLTNAHGVGRALNPGNSGGALADAHSRVVGINTAVAGVGLGLAVPVNTTTRRIISALMQDGRVRRAYLGIVSVPAPLPAPLRERFDQPDALRVVEVVSGGPADRAGLRAGDLLISAGGRPVQKAQDLQRLMFGEAIGQPLAITVMRNGALVDVIAEPSELVAA